MAMAVLLIEAASGAAAVAPEAVAKLTSLGVSHVSLLQDGDGYAVVLEGWSFDPRSSLDDAVEMVCERSAKCRTLLPLAQLSLSGTGNGKP